MLNEDTVREKENSTHHFLGFDTNFLYVLDGIRVINGSIVTLHILYNGNLPELLRHD